MSKPIRRFHSGGETFLAPDTDEFRGIERSGHKLRVTGSVLRLLGSVGIVAGIIMGSLTLSPMIYSAITEASGGASIIDALSDVLLSHSAKLVLSLLVMSVTIRIAGSEMIASTPLSKAIASKDAVKLPYSEVFPELAPDTIHGMSTDLFLYSATEIGLIEDAMYEVKMDAIRVSKEMRMVRDQEARLEKLNRISDMARHQKEGT